MSRLYLILVVLFFFFFNDSIGQTLLNKYLNYADAQIEKGDLIEAINYYELILKEDSTNLDVRWKYAEALRNYKDYEKAASNYKFIFKTDNIQNYTNCLVYWAMMEKQLGNYEKALELFQLGQNTYKDYKKDYSLLKCNREVESCKWAIKNQDSSLLYPLKLNPNLNTAQAEFGHYFTKNELIYSKLTSKNITNYDEVIDTNYFNKLFKINLFDSTKETPLIEENKFEKHVGNGSYSLDRKRFYFSACKAENNKFSCKIAVSINQGKYWSEPQLLSEPINEEDYTSTMPSVGQINGQEVLFFVSNRQREDENNLNIYYTFLKENGKPSPKAIDLKTVNSIENETSPYFDPTTNRLYFSSPWWNGYGGSDIHYVKWEKDKFSNPINCGLPINSPQNESYFTGSKDTLVVTSNRFGTVFSLNPTCCSDVFAYTTSIQPSIEIIEKTETALNNRASDTTETTLKIDNVQIQPLSAQQQETKTPPVKSIVELESFLQNKPIVLYFHNDQPQPNSTDTITSLNYLKTYQDYTALIPKYKSEYSKGLLNEQKLQAEKDIDAFFTDYVKAGLNNLESFSQLLMQELEKGKKIKLTIQGYASPLAKSEYNVSLTKRRISSFKNYLAQYNNGVLIKYLNGSSTNGGKLIIEGIPYGEYTSATFVSDNPNDKKNAIYSRAAGIERKIAIKSIQLLAADSINDLIQCTPRIIDTKETFLLDYTNGTFKLKSFFPTSLEIEKIESKNNAFDFKFTSKLEVNQTIEISFKQREIIGLGNFSVPVKIYFKNQSKPFEVLIVGAKQ